VALESELEESLRASTTDKQDEEALKKLTEENKKLVDKVNQMTA
jgi:hypothetical protein